MLSSPTTDEKGNITSPLSAYQPSDAVKAVTQKIRSAVENGDEILKRSFPEFNDMSLIQRMNEDQKAWLSWTPAPSDDPDFSWQWNGVRPITRNKIISTAAHLTSKVIYPNILAQNDDDEEDKEAGYVMKELLEYNMDRSKYDLTFLYAVISGLVNPVSYMKVDYCEVYQDILEGTNSEYTRKKVLDDVLSGFQNNLLPPDEILISNPYTFNFQMQPEIMHRRRISYDEAEALHGHSDNWQHVKVGKVSVPASDGLFYDVDDTVGDGLLEEITYKNRRGDQEITMVNGIYVANPNTDFNPIKHRDNKNRPKYNIVKFGTEPIDAMRFWAYKSLASKLSNDQELADRMWQIAMDASQVEAYKPIITVGAGKMDRSVTIPATVTDMPKGAEIHPLSGISNSNAAFQALQQVEKSMSETSVDPNMSGVSTGPKKTATESVFVQENAMTNLGIQLTMMASMVAEIGELMVDDIIHYQTVGEVSEILGGIPRMKYRSFLLQNKIKNGKNVTEQIKFTDRYAGKKMTKEEITEEGLKLATEAGNNKEIWLVNPAMFANRKFLIKVTADMVSPKTEAFETRYKLGVYDRAIANPYVDQVGITRDFLLEPLVKGEATKYMKDEKALAGIIPGQEGNTLEKPKEETALEKVGAI